MRAGVARRPCEIDGEILLTSHEKHNRFVVQVSVPNVVTKMLTRKKF